MTGASPTTTFSPCNSDASILTRTATQSATLTFPCCIGLLSRLAWGENKTPVFKLQIVSGNGE